ncbi:MAG: T9SS type A sorting domain-containing protein [Sporocytophaga sp.]|uniref:CUB domain-containing protein n=1 Tax=Sporocytophaga sp. TaxID=2231183 RepID=UPI001B2F1BF4|nr:CUB domain-containing protein [Sporocytophaga sp.]MBO9702518.1 T9SS type A sorting domain-containing protein [Sporocytophaga sp.]
MKKLLLALCFCLSLSFYSTFAFDIGNATSDIPDVIYPGEAFDMDWGAGLFTHVGETQPALTIKCNFYLSKDAILDNGDAFLASSSVNTTPTTGSFGKAVYGVLVTPEMNFPAGKCYFIMSVDPDNQITEEDKKNNVKAYEVIIGNRNPDLAMLSVNLGTSDKSGVLNIKTAIINPSDSPFSSFRYVIRLASTEANLATPLVEKIYDNKEFKNVSTPMVFDNSLTLPTSLDLNSPFYVSVTIETTVPADQGSLNNTIVKQVVWSQLQPLVFYAEKILMTNRNDSLRTCNVQIFDDGSEAANYSPNINSTIRIFPAEPNSIAMITLKKSNYGLFAYNDYIQFINPDDKAIIGQLYQSDAYSLPKSYVSSSKDGSIIVKFISDGYNQNTGFEMTASCLDTTGIYKLKYKQINSITTCNKLITDNGFLGSYQANSDDQLTIYPEQAGQKVMLSFTEFYTESYDYLSVYNGNSNVAASLIKKLSGSTMPANITSTAADGSLTLFFHSDYSGNYSGFSVNTTCTAVTSIDGSAEKEFLGSSLQINPNPNNGNFRLSVKDGQNLSAATITVLDVKGQELYHSVQSIDSPFNLKSVIQPGFYIIKIETPENGVNFQRFIVE